MPIKDVQDLGVLWTKIECLWIERERRVGVLNADLFVNVLNE